MTLLDALIALLLVIDEFVVFGATEAVQRQGTRQPDEADQGGLFDASALVIGVLGRVGVGAVGRFLRRRVVSRRDGGGTQESAAGAGLWACDLALRLARCWR